jgi:hypothetical protein
MARGLIYLQSMHDTTRHFPRPDPKSDAKQGLAQIELQRSTVRYHRHLQLEAAEIHNSLKEKNIHISRAYWSDIAALEVYTKTKLKKKSSFFVHVLCPGHACEHWKKWPCKLNSKQT